MATFNGNKRTTPARPAGGDEVCEGNVRGPAPPVANSRPVVTIEDPPEGGELARRGALQFTVTDPDGDALPLQRLLLRSGGDAAPWVQAYVEGAACVGFSVTRSVIPDGYRYVVTRDAGWPPGRVDLDPIFADATARETGINE